MARLLKQSTAFTFRIGPFVDSTDGVTAETGLTIAQADIQISKNGGAFAQTSATTPTTTHDTDGWYQCPLTTVDTGTVGPLTVQIVMTGALPVWEHFEVVTANVYDSAISGTDLVDVNAAQIAGSTAAATQLEANIDTSEAGTASGTPTTTTMVSDISVTVDDQFKGKIIIFASDTTTASLRRQATDITACTASTNTLTFTALTTAPVSGDTFVIV